MKEEYIRRKQSDLDDDRKEIRGERQGRRGMKENQENKNNESIK